MTPEDHQTVEAMERWGGSFVKQLAKLMLLADPENFLLLKLIFDKYWKEYQELAKLL